MKIKLKLFVVLLGILTISSCNKSEILNDEAEITASYEKGDNLFKQSQPLFNSRYTMTYIGNNRWSAYYWGVNLTISGCTPTDLYNHLNCDFRAILGQGGPYLSVNDYSVTIATASSGSFSVKVWGYDAKTDASGKIIYPIRTEWKEHTITITAPTGGGSLTIPFKVIIVNSKPYIVDARYTSGLNAGLPEMIGD